MSADFSKVHEDLKALKQFCLRAEKQPFTKDRKAGRYVPNGWQLNKEQWLTFEEALKDLEAGISLFHNGVNWPADGIGILVVGNGKDEPQLLGGDLDACRDPITGAMSPWSRKFLEQIRPFYTEISPSGCGFRYFVMGRLPAGRYFVLGYGPQTDMGPEMMNHIISVKPKVRDKLLSRDPAFNGLEFHQSAEPKDDGSVSAKHLTITGNRLDEFCFEKEDRTEAIKEAIDEIIREAPIIRPSAPAPAWAQEMETEANKNRFPKLELMTVLQRAGFEETEESGGQVLGWCPPLLPSTTGHNIVVNPIDGQYCWMHNGINAGGDAWVWLAHECGAVPWEVKGSDIVWSQAVKDRTLGYAVEKELIKAEQIFKEPSIRRFSEDLGPGEAGIAPDGTIMLMGQPKTVYVKGQEMTIPGKPTWLSDCALCLHTETREDEITEFKFRGIGARDGLTVCFTLPAGDMADAKKFRGELINAFGGKNRVGKLTFEIVQNMSLDIIKKQRVTMPCWRKNIPLVPGLDIVSNVEFKLSSLTPALVYDGDIKTASDALKRLIVLRKYTPLLVATVLGAPIFAKCFPRDRFGLALWGKSGSHKTTLAKLASTIYGVGFFEEHALIKHGRHGGTAVGAMEALLLAGILPRILDNVKATDAKDVQLYISLIHAIMEGGEKLRGKKDGGLRKTNQFLTTPIVTGEVRPSEASTSARVFNLTWAKVDDSQALTAVEEDIHLFPVVGYHWLKFLSSCNRDIKTGFEEARTRKYNEYLEKNYVNMGRLATIYCLLRMTWALAKESPFGAVFEECEPVFLAALEDAIHEQGQLVTEETEVAKFMAALNELIANRPNAFMIGEIPGASNVILGRMNDKGLFVFPNETLAVMKQQGVFTQVPNVASLTNALVEEGVLVSAKETDRKLYQMKVNGNKVRGWLFKPRWNEKPESESEVPEEV